MSFVVSGARVVDPVTGEDAVRDVFVEGGAIVGAPPRDPQRVDGSGCVIAPSFVDLHAALLDADDVEAAVAGGFGAVVLSPELPSAADRPGEVRARLAALRSDGRLRVEATGALTRGLGGEELGEMGRLLEAGCVAMSQGSIGVSHAGVLRHALEYAGRLGATVMIRPTDVLLEGDGLVREGPRALWLGLPGVPPEAEEIGVYRLAALSRLAGCAVHLTHLWSARGVGALRAVRAGGARITASTTAHHLALSDAIVEQWDYGPEARLVPPLGDDEDRAALVGAVREGVIDAVATDHLPLGRHLRERDLPGSPPGAVGLVTALALALETLGVVDAVRALSAGPARVLGWPAAGVRVGDPADLVLFEPDARWEVGADLPLGSERNTPLLGRHLRGRARGVWRSGRLVGRLDPAA